MILVEKLKLLSAPSTTDKLSDALGTLSGDVTLDTDLTIRINNKPLKKLTPEEIVNFFRDDNLLRMLRDSDAGTRQQIQAILSTNFTPRQIEQLPTGILFMLGFPVPIRDLVADLDLSNMVRPTIEFATHLRERFVEIVRILRTIGGGGVDITGLERLTEGALQDLINQTNSLTDETTATQLVRRYGIIDVIINLLNIEDESRRILAGIRGLLPDTQDNQNIIASLDNLLEDERGNDLRLAITDIRGLLPAPPAPVVISPEVLEKLDKKGISSEEAKRRIRNMENPNFDDFDEVGELSQEDIAKLSNFDVSGDDTIPVATVPAIRIENLYADDNDGWINVTSPRDQRRNRNPLLNRRGQHKLSTTPSFTTGPSPVIAPAPAPAPVVTVVPAARANIPNNKLITNLMDYLRDSERQPVVTLSEEDKTKYKSDRSKYKSTRKHCKICNTKHYLPLNCDKDAIKKKCVMYDVKGKNTQGTSNMNSNDRKKVVRAKIKKLRR